MSKQKQSAEASVYQLKVTIQDSQPPIWRRIQVMNDTSLDVLHRILQVLMGWEDYHLHQFVVGNVMYGPHDPNLDFDLDIEDEKDVTLGQILSRVKDKFTYEYDFGDDWGHLITLEKVLAPEAGVDYPICLTGKRACPPEDCGGIFGFYGFLEAISDPEHPEHNDMLEWVGGEFDPEAFDQDDINRSLKSMRSRAQQFGELPPSYAFILNPHQDLRCTKCPQCEQLTRLRKFPLLIHIKQLGLITQGKTCRFCPKCKILIVHQDELEAQLAEHLRKDAPEAVSDDYFVLGTVERKTWRKGMGGELSFEELRQNTADFAEHLQLEYEPGGWYRD